ncbi:MAG: amidohydrolase family protein [Glaciecola sp.]
MLDQKNHEFRIDSHSFYWKKETDYYDWVYDEVRVVPSDLTKDGIFPKKQFPISSMLVQARPDIQETRHLLQIAQADESVLGVVACIDMFSPTALRDIALLSKNAYLKGVRPSPQNTVKLNWLLETEMINVFGYLSNLHISFDALVKPRDLNNLLEVSHRFPKLHIAIDHSAKPSMIMRNFERWSTAIAMLAQQDNVYCKLSGLVSDARYNVDVDDIIPYMQYLYHCFGAHRLMWGSDWPILNLMTDYEAWLGITNAFLSSMSAAEKQSILSQSAVQFYNLRSNKGLLSNNNMQPFS